MLDLLELPFVRAEKLQRSPPSYCLDATLAGSNSGLAHDLEQRDFRRVAHVGATAQLAGDSRNRYHAHDVAVFLGEKMHRTTGDRFVVRLLLERQLHAVEDFAVNQILDLRELLWSEWTVMGKIESQAIRR